MTLYHPSLSLATIAVQFSNKFQILLPHLSSCENLPYRCHGSNLHDTICHEVIACIPVACNSPTKQKLYYPNQPQLYQTIVPRSLNCIKQVLASSKITCKHHTLHVTLRLLFFCKFFGVSAANSGHFIWTVMCLPNHHHHHQLFSF